MGGETALCVLALLDAGLEPDEEHIQRALHKLSADRDLPTTYARSLQTMVFCRADPVRYSQQIHANYLWLQQNQIADGPRKGAWSYPGGNGDNSNSQFALLALYEAQRAFDAMHDSMHAASRSIPPSGDAPGPIGKVVKTPTALGAITRTWPARAA